MKFTTFGAPSPRNVTLRKYAVHGGLQVTNGTLTLVGLSEQEAEAARVKLKGAHVAPEWGRQVRSYVLHPYKMVKDHRSGYETADAEGVLEGGIDGLLEAFLLHSVGADSEA